MIKDTLFFVLGTLSPFILLLLVIVVGVVIYKRSTKNKSADVSGKDTSKKDDEPGTWTWEHKFGRSFIVVVLWTALNLLGWYGLLPKFWEEWYALEQFFWASQTTIILLFLLNVVFRNDSNKPAIRTISWLLALVLIISAGLEVKTYGKENKWWSEEDEYDGSKGTSKTSAYKYSTYSRCDELKRKGYVVEPVTLAANGRESRSFKAGRVKRVCSGASDVKINASNGWSEVVCPTCNFKPVVSPNDTFRFSSVNGKPVLLKLILSK